jgi:glycogen debranching enzyme
VTDATELSFDNREIPFSYRGSWLDLSPVVALHSVTDTVHLVSHQTGMHAVLRLAPERNDSPIACQTEASPASLVWRSEGHVRVEAAFESVDTVRIRGAGCNLRIADAAVELTPFTGTYFFQDPLDGSAIFTSYETGRRYRITAIEGTLRFVGSEALGASAREVIATGPGNWEIAIEEFETARAPYLTVVSFLEVKKAAQKSFTAYSNSIAGWATGRSPGAELAAYVLWSATVEPRGFLHRESILMSKHWMDKVWSWDHCFNAFALAEASAASALDQFFTPFDHQDSAGALPDSVTHSEILYNFVKPPIHGWALAKLRAIAVEELDAATLSDLYAHIAAESRFWLDFRRAPGHTLAHYQHGNDSGWDNSTIFDFDRLVESPDLAGFLIVQFDVLAELADELGNGEGRAWRGERDAMRTALLESLWDGESFFARAVTSARKSKTTSLLNLLPIVAGHYLPNEVRTKLVAGIRNHLTSYGPATQLPGSAEYEDDGYWRGPIWAPSTLIIEDGLRRIGEAELADEVSANFRALCEKSGFAENFDAMTGEGLRDRAYTWTASAYLVLAREAEARG